MKKILVLLAVTMLLLAGCSRKEEKKPLEIDIEAVKTTLLADEQFAGVSQLTEAKVELKYGVDLMSMEEGVFCFPGDSENANMFIIAKASEGNENDLYDEIDIIVDTYYHSWCDIVYNAQEADKVEKRTIEKVDGYYICVISNDNQAVIDLIKK